MAHIGPLSVFVNKVLLEYIPPIHALSVFTAARAEVSRSDGDHMAHKAENIY